MKKIPVRTNDDIIESASVTALMRYLLSHESGQSRNPDYLGNLFVNGKWSHYLDNPISSKELLEKKLPGCIYYHLVRTKTFDDAMLTWIKKEKNSQIIILGTGFDSRAIRFEKIIRDNNIKIYEVDLKAMLDYKKSIIQEKIRINTDHISFVACNFQKDNVVEMLSQHQFDFNKPTLILWEGVTYFLTKENIEFYIQLFKDNIKNKLKIVLDYAFRDYIEGDFNFYGAQELNQILIELDEPHLFGLNYREVDDFFDSRGYLIKNNCTSLMLEALYLKDSFGNSVGKPHAFHGIVEIIKK